MPNDTYNHPLMHVTHQRKCNISIHPILSSKLGESFGLHLQEAEKDLGLISLRSKLTSLRQMPIISIMMSQESMKKSFATM